MWAEIQAREEGSSGEVGTEQASQDKGTGSGSLLTSQFLRQKVNLTPFSWDDLDLHKLSKPFSQQRLRHRRETRLQSSLHTKRSLDWSARDLLFEGGLRSEEHTSELQSLMRISYAVFCLKKKKTTNKNA